jgi:pilus assembly protein Flp/PilA
VCVRFRVPGWVGGKSQPGPEEFSFLSLQSRYLTNALCSPIFLQTPDLSIRIRFLHKVDFPMLARFHRRVVAFLHSEEGPTAVEYAIMMALIIVVCVTAMATLGNNSNNTYSYVGTKVGRVPS